MVIGESIDDDKEVVDDEVSDTPEGIVDDSAPDPHGDEVIEDDIGIPLDDGDEMPNEEQVNGDMAPPNPSARIDALHARATNIAAAFKALTSAPVQPSGLQKLCIDITSLLDDIDQVMRTLHTIATDDVVGKLAEQDSNISDLMQIVRDERSRMFTTRTRFVQQLNKQNQPAPDDVPDEGGNPELDEEGDVTPQGPDDNDEQDDVPDVAPSPVAALLADIKQRFTRLTAVDYRQNADRLDEVMEDFVAEFDRIKALITQMGQLAQDDDGDLLEEAYRYRTELATRQTLLERLRQLRLNQPDDNEGDDAPDDDDEQDSDDNDDVETPGNDDGVDLNDGEFVVEDD